MSIKKATLRPFFTYFRFLIKTNFSIPITLPYRRRALIINRQLKSPGSNNMENADVHHTGGRGRTQLALPQNAGRTSARASQALWFHFPVIFPLYPKSSPFPSTQREGRKLEGHFYISSAATKSKFHLRRLELNSQSHSVIHRERSAVTGKESGFPGCNGSS